VEPGGIADISHPCGTPDSGGGPNIVDISDLLVVIAGWGHCPLCDPGSGEEMPQSIQDCIDRADARFAPNTPEWSDFVDGCIEALCAAQIIECD
jgi:hypothetical protein